MVAVEDSNATFESIVAMDPESSGATQAQAVPVPLQMA
jgi:hypothetical protein